MLAPLALLAPDDVDYRTQIEPILSRRCYECHGPSKQKNGLRLDNKADAMRGGDSGAVLVPGKGSQSELVRRIRSKDDTEYMPPKGSRLTVDEIDLIRLWVDQGVRWPPDAAKAPAEKTITKEQREYWAFRPIRRPEPPAVRRAGWVSAPIDAFILAKLEGEGIEPAPPAPKPALIRRVAFDLTGLPPTPEELDRFEKEPYDRMVEHYLASPRYGERWAQHWLDVVRFAESEGFEYDTPIRSLWKFRDYVIRSMNDDKPFDRFVLEQVAGDELDPGNRDSLIAAGFHRLGAVRRNAGNQEVASSRNEVLTDRTDIIGAAFLGLTVGCARCHDHKFDPILQKDYYRLQAFLAATEERNIPLVSPDEEKQWKKRTDAINAEIKELKRRAKEDNAQLAMEIEKLQDALPPQLPGINTITNLAEPTPIAVLRRGDWTKKGEPVGMRFPSVLLEDDAVENPLRTPKPRTLLARWLVDPKNPLTPRVLVNRVWQHHFGHGIVKTPNDFGANGGGPSHPELLDYVAGAFVQGGWRLKPLHRMILHTSAYRQSSSSALGAEKDPDNRWFWRFERRRLSAEEIRDAALSVSGELNRKMYGESVFLPVDQELVSALYKPAQWAVTRDREEHFRRSIYLVAKRNLRLPSMEVFDQPGLGGSCACREASTHAPQALELLNGRMTNELAAFFAVRIEREKDRVDAAFRLALGRLPTDREKKISEEFLERHLSKEFTLAMFNLNGFLYVQ